MAEGSSRGKSDLSSSDSVDSRWVYQDEEWSQTVNDGEEEGGGSGGAEDSPRQLDSDDEDSGEYKLIRTEPRIDPFDVEALEVRGAQRNNFENVTLARKIVLAFLTLGVVFGDVGTSPLYTFSVMFSKAPANGKEDVLGALSLVLYTLILIPLIKYALIVLWANDDGEDVLGALSLVFYTLILIPLIKYALIVLWANDVGEGGTFALYSLICRHAKVSLLPNQLPSDARISIFRLEVPSTELDRSLKIKERLEASLVLKKLLLMLVLAGTSMVIADGVVTPAMSVISAVDGLKIGVSGIKQDHVVMISVSFLIILFSVQRYGTSKVGIVIGPALFIWFCSLGAIGIYNLIKYDTRVLRAFNPIHIYYFFKRNSTNAWYSLGGCLLCATDLCYFSVRSVQLTFVFLVLPCLLLGYLGQAAYLMENHEDTTQAFFSSVPRFSFGLVSAAAGVFWPVFLIANVAALIASRTMTTATFSCIKQSIALGCFPRLKIIHTSRKFRGQIYIPVMNWFLLALTLVLVCNISSIYEIGNAYGIAELGVMMMTTILVTLVMLLIWQTNIFVVLSFAIIFLCLELTFFSSVLWSVGDGSWIILVFAIVIFLIMYIWNYGSKLKYETEVKRKMSMDLLRELGPNLGTVRAPGVGLLYNELAKGVPAIFGYFLTTLPAVHSMVIFVCIKYVTASFVPQSERFLFTRVCSRGYHLFRCIARYGYKDVRKENHEIFEKLLIESLEKFIRREAKERSLETDGDDSESEEEYSMSKFLIAPNGSVYSLAVPLLDELNNRNNFISEASTSEEVKLASTEQMIVDAEESLEMELSILRKAKESGIVYLLGHGDIRARKSSWFIKKLVVNYFYAFLRKNCRRGTANLSVPHSRLIQVGMTYMV